MNRLCTICARAGSKGVKNKNIKLLLGKPLISYTILQAIDSNLFDFIAVSSDSEEILDIAKIYGVDLCLKRPDELATDHAAKLPVIQHCAKEVEIVTGKLFDTYVDLDATSPLRTPDDIKNVVDLLESTS